jgi:hypothetical protein
MTSGAQIYAFSGPGLHFAADALEFFEHLPGPEE